jgi:hypothetical protein
MTLQSDAFDLSTSSAVINDLPVTPIGASAQSKPLFTRGHLMRVAVICDFSEENMELVSAMLLQNLSERYASVLQAERIRLPMARRNDSAFLLSDGGVDKRWAATQRGNEPVLSSSMATTPIPGCTLIGRRGVGSLR